MQALRRAERDHDRHAPSIRRSVDFVVTREADSYAISALSLRGRAWLSDRIAKRDLQTLRPSDAAVVNRLIGSARAEGYLTEYVGPNATIYF